MAEAPQMQQLTPEQQKELQERIKNMSPEELLDFQRQQCIFCQIVSGRIPAKKLHDDDFCQAILDINPAAKGHVLIIPKEHYAIMPQIPDDIIGHMFKVTKRISQLLLKTLRGDGTSIFIANGLAAGQKAQHFMIHVIPRREGDGLLSLNEKYADETETEQVKVVISNRLQELLGMKKEIVEVRGRPEKEKTKESALKTKDSSQKKEKAKASIHLPEDDPDKKEDGSGEEEDDGDDRDVNLDDIANLFR